MGMIDRREEAVYLRQIQLGVKSVSPGLLTATVVAYGVTVLLILIHREPNARSASSYRGTAIAKEGSNPFAAGRAPPEPVGRNGVTGPEAC
jgi:hypothetical protein